MMEVSMTELFLFAWGAIATGYALKYKSQRSMFSFMLQKIVEDVDLYTQMREGWLKVKGL